MCFEPPDYLRHILLEADYLTNQCSSLTAEVYGGRYTSACVRPESGDHRRSSEEDP